MLKKPSLTLDSNIVGDDQPLGIVPKLYVGSIHTAYNADALLANGITHILNASRIPGTFPKQFTYLSVEIRDKEDANILACIPTTNIFIEAGLDNGGVLVHCFGGKSRSPAFIAAYLMSSYHYTFDQAYEIIKTARPSADINIGFECQLRAYGAANCDVYVAQQLLLRARIRDLHLIRGDKKLLADTSDAKIGRSPPVGVNSSSSTGLRLTLEHQDTFSNPHHAIHSSGLNSGHKRSLDRGRLALGLDDSNDDSSSVEVDHSTTEEGEEQQSPPANKAPYRGQHHSDAMEESQEGTMSVSSSSMDYSSGSSGAVEFASTLPTQALTFHTGSGASKPTSRTHYSSSRRNLLNTSGHNGSNNSSGSNKNKGADKNKNPTCRLSRPGTSWVRVIPPLRGLERDFKCSWCNTTLFQLGSVIRLDVQEDMYSMLDSYLAMRNEVLAKHAHDLTLREDPEDAFIQGKEEEKRNSKNANFHVNLMSALKKSSSNAKLSPQHQLLVVGNLPPIQGSFAVADNKNGQMDVEEDSHSQSYNTSPHLSIAYHMQTMQSQSEQQPVQQVLPRQPLQTTRHARSMNKGFDFTDMDDDDYNNDVNIIPPPLQEIPSSLTFGGSSTKIMPSHHTHSFSASSSDSHLLIDRSQPGLILGSSSDRGAGARYNNNNSQGKSSPRLLPALSHLDMNHNASSATLQLAHQPLVGSNSHQGQAPGHIFQQPTVPLFAPLSWSTSNNTMAMDSSKNGGESGDSRGGLMLVSPQHLPPVRAPGQSSREGSRVHSPRPGSASGVSGGGMLLPATSPRSNNKQVLPALQTSHSNCNMQHGYPSSSSVHNNNNNKPSFYDESPRVTIPPAKMFEGLAAFDRPRSAEKMRWLARANLLREGDKKVASLADADESASQQAFDQDPYFHVEYLEWMGKEIFQMANDHGDICCPSCAHVVGSFIWTPSLRIKRNGRLEAPLFRINKNVVIHSDVDYDLTPSSTPRISMDES